GALREACGVDLRRLRQPRRPEERAERRRREALRLRLELARLGRDRPRRLLDREPGQPDPDVLRRRPAARDRRVGARLLLEVPEPAPRLPRGVVERREMARGRGALRDRYLLLIF